MAGVVYSTTMIWKIRVVSIRIAGTSIFISVLAIIIIAVDVGWNRLGRG